MDDEAPRIKRTVHIHGLCVNSQIYQIIYFVNLVCTTTVFVNVWWCFAVRLFQRHIRRDVLLLLLQMCNSQVFYELKKDVVVAMEFILSSSMLDFPVVRGLLPLMSDYQLDLLSDQVSSQLYIFGLNDKSCMHLREYTRTVSIFNQPSISWVAFLFIDVTIVLVSTFV